MGFPHAEDEARCRECHEAGAVESGADLAAVAA